MKHVVLLFYFLAYFITGTEKQVYGKNSDSGQDAILLIHGLAGASSTWNTLISAMDNSPYQYVSNYKVIHEYKQKRIISSNQNIKQSSKKSLVFTLDFSDNQNLSFNEQGEEVALVISKIRSDYKVDNIILIGHSMGGLAARAYINNYGPVGIKGLITVTSPHLGSYLGYLRDVYYRCKGFQPILKTMKLFFSSVYGPKLPDLCDGVAMINTLANMFEGLDLSSAAVGYLTPDSDEMLELNSHPFPSNIPVANVISNWETNNMTLDFLKKDILTNITKLIQSRYQPGDSKISYFSNALNSSCNDGIVPVSSQYMKLAVTNGQDFQIDTYFVNCAHTDSPKETTTIFAAIDNVLKSDQQTQQDKKSIVFILDSSGSMKESDPDNMRLNALASLAEEMDLFKNVMIIDFDDKVNWVNSDNFTHPDFNRLRDEIMTIDADGGTNIGQAFLFTTDILQRFNLTETTTVVLLTDGLGDYSGEANWFKERRIPVFTISLMDNINEKLLYDIARETNGVYFKAHSEFDIIDAYYSITSQLNSMSIICKERTRGSGSFQKTFMVEPGAFLFRISLFSNSALEDVSLIPPGTSNQAGQYMGNMVSPSYFGTKIDRPAAGSWTIRYKVKGNPQTLATESQIMVSVKAEPIVTYSVNSTNNDLIKLVSNQNSISGNININNRIVSVLTPQNRILKVENHQGDELNFHPTDGSGTYKFDLQLYGTVNNLPFERFFTFSVLHNGSGQIKAQKIREMLGNTAYVETNSSKSEIGDEYLFYCIEPSNERLVAKGIVTASFQNTCTVELTDTYTTECNNGQIIPILNRIHETK
jgi:pimeloyl-ACP methyl ester carboxylesterase